MGKTSNKFGTILKGRNKDLIFYVLMLAFPVSQFAIFYIGVNFNSVLLTFREIDILDGTTVWTFKNLGNAFERMFTNPSMLTMMGTSLLSWALILVIGTPLGLLFSFYIYKKMPASGVFRVLLFMPSIISAIVMAGMFMFFVERAIPAIARQYLHIDMEGLLQNNSTRYGTIIFYNIWVGFGIGVLMYSNAMSGISQEIVESAHLDGASGIREFWHISLPLVYPTVSTFIVTGIAGIFNNQIALYSFYGGSAPENIQTYGYYIYMRTIRAQGNTAEYPPIAAMGFIMTLIVVPFTLAVRWALEKFGPKEN